MNRLELFKSDINQLIESKQLPGAQYSLSQDFKNIISESAGFRDLDHQISVTASSLFRLASATKVFLSVGFLRLVQQGAIALETPVSDIFPEYKQLQVLGENGVVSPSKRIMRMIDLLRHSCGYGYGDVNYLDGAYRHALESNGLLGIDADGSDHWLHPYGLREWASVLAQVPLEDEPGTRVSYGLGHDIAGAIIETVSRQRLDVFMHEQVFAPLGLSNTFFTVPDGRKKDLTNYYSYYEKSLHLIETAQQSEFLCTPKSFSGGGGWDMLGNGGLVTNAVDFVKLLEMIVNNGQNKDAAFLSQAHAQLLCQSQSAGLAHKDMLPGCEYSLGTAEVIDPKLYHEKGTGSSGPKGKMWWGGSTNTYFFYVPQTKRVGVFLSHTFPFGHCKALYKFGALSE